MKTKAIILAILLTVPAPATADWRSSLGIFKDKISNVGKKVSTSVSSVSNRLFTRAATASDSFTWSQFVARYYKPIVSNGLVDKAGSKGKREVWTIQLYDGSSVVKPDCYLTADGKSIRCGNQTIDLPNVEYFAIHGEDGKDLLN